MNELTPQSIEQWREVVVCGQKVPERTENRFHNHVGPLSIGVCEERHYPLDGPPKNRGTWCGIVEFGVGMLADGGKSRFVVAHIEGASSLDDAVVKLNAAAAATFGELGRCIEWAKGASNV